MNESTDNGVQPVQADDIQSNAHLGTSQQVNPEDKDPDAPQTKPEGDEKPEGDGSDKKDRQRPGRAERDNFRLQQRIAELEAKLSSNNGANSKPPANDGEPKLEDFDDAIEWSKAQAKYEAKIALEGYKAEQQQANQQKQFQELVVSHEEREADYAENIPDYEEKVTSLLQSGMVTPDIQVAVLHSDMSPEIAYYLATDEGGQSDLLQLQQIQGNPQALKQAIKLIEAHIKAKSADAAVKKTNAPQPISPVKGKASTATKALDEMDYDEYVKAREAQLRR